MALEIKHAHQTGVGGLAGLLGGVLVGAPEWNRHAV